MGMDTFDEIQAEDYYTQEEEVSAILSTDAEYEALQPLDLDDLKILENYVTALLKEMNNEPNNTQDWATMMAAQYVIWNRQSNMIAAGA